MVEELDYASSFFAELNTKMNDLEERQRLLKERVILIGQNLIETKEEMGREIIEMKVILEDNKQDIKKLKEAVLRLSDEVDKKARKNEVEILAKQMKMFQPLEFLEKR